MYDIEKELLEKNKNAVFHLCEMLGTKSLRLPSMLGYEVLKRLLDDVGQYIWSQEKDQKKNGGKKWLTKLRADLSVAYVKVLWLEKSHIDTVKKTFVSDKDVFFVKCTLNEDENRQNP